MSRTWKWILGILAALVILGLVAGAAFLWWNHPAMVLRDTVARPAIGGTPQPGTPNQPQRPMMPYGFQSGRGRGMEGWGGMPMMGARGFHRLGGFTPFGIGLFFVGGLLHLILPLGILALVAFLFYEMGKRAGASAAASASPAPDQAPLPGRRVAKR
jgi:hypothetical protein